MNTRSSQISPGLSPLKMRLLAVGMFIVLLLVGAVSLYAYTNYLFPLYGRLLRGAPVVETPYLAFGLLMAPPALAILLVGVLLVGLLRREKHGIANIGFESVLVLVLYVLGVTALVTA